MSVNTDVDQLVESGQLAEAILSLEATIRQRPGDFQLRVYLFQLLSVTGQWARAAQLVTSLGSLNAEWLPTSLAYRGLVESELVRASVFSGSLTPLILGEPEPWLANLIRALALDERGEARAADELRGQALDDSPATPFKRNGDSRISLLDADSRLGPVLEVVVDGKYYWVPFARLNEIEVLAPESMADNLWAQVRFIWSSGGESNGFIPMRYIGSELCDEDSFRRAKSTSFTETRSGVYHGLGQRLLLDGHSEIPLSQFGKAVFSEEIGGRQ